MSKKVTLNSDFVLPAYQTGVEVLLVLAGAIGKVFSASGAIDVLDSSDRGDWIEFLLLLGKLSVNSQTKVNQTALIGDLWNTFFGQNDVKSLEKEVLGVFQAARDSSVDQATSGRSIVSYLDGANDSGHKIVQRILTKHGVAHLLPSATTPVEVFYDGLGEKYCAGSSLWTNLIRWAYQPVPHALWGAVLADLVFAHEYLSHLVARNKYLDSTIREQWLVAAFRGALEDDKLAPYWKIRLWAPYRSALESHVTGLARILQPDASVVRYSGLQGAEENLRVLHNKDPKLFWRLTVEILESKNDREIAENAFKIAKSLAHRGLPDVPIHKISNINELAKLVSQ